MKKTILLLTVAILFNCLCSCGSLSSEEIAITTENFNQYFTINSYTENYYAGEGLLSYEADCTWVIEIIPNKDFDAKDVKVKLNVTPTGWKASEIIEGEENNYIELIIPSSGELQKVIQCSYQSIWAIAPDYPSCTLVEVEGSILQ